MSTIGQFSEDGTLKGGTTGQILTKNSATDGDYSWANAAGGGGGSGGKVLQRVYAAGGSNVSGTANLLADNSIPQNTEGTEFMTISITPQSATSILVVRFSGWFGLSAAGFQYGAGIFRDSTADAIAASTVYAADVWGAQHMECVANVASGSTTATTFKFRAGGQGGAAMHMSQTYASALMFSTAQKSFMEIWEVEV